MQQESFPCFFVVLRVGSRVSALTHVPHPFYFWGQGFVKLLNCQAGHKLTSPQPQPPSQVTDVWHHGATYTTSLEQEFLAH